MNIDLLPCSFFRENEVTQCHDNEVEGQEDGKRHQKWEDQKKLETSVTVDYGPCLDLECLFIVHDM